MTKISEGLPQLQKRIKELEEELEIKNKLIFALEDSVPKIPTERKKYVADIHFFYATIFKNKIKHFIGMQLEELAQVGRSELGSNILRSNINCFRLIQEWFERMSNEHMGDVEEINNSLDSNKDFINKLKKTYEN